MSLYIDRKFLLQISHRFRNFKQKKENLFNFSCPFCGDSKRKTTKARGYVYNQDDHYVFKCHNCTKTTGISGLLKHIDPTLYTQYALESFNNTHLIISDTKKISKSTSMFIDPPEIPLETIGGLPEGHYALDYVMHRQIPHRFWNDLYFAPDFREFVDHFYPDHKKDLPSDDPRLVIPFYNEHKILCGFQGRALRNPEIRYITIKIVEDALKVYGMDRVDPAEIIYVLEGPIDSMFLPNAVATCDSDLRKASQWLPKQNLVLVYDNEYYQPIIRKLLERSIESGFQVCIFPKTIKSKDINQMVIDEGLTCDTIKSIVADNTFSGLKAKLELKNHG